MTDTRPVLGRDMSATDPHCWRGDFGLSGYTTFFSQPCMSLPREDALSVIESLAEDEAYRPWYTNWVVVDVRKLLDSSLPDEALNTLWLAATIRAYFDPESKGIAIRDWLEQVADTARVHQDERFQPPGPPPNGGLREAVLAELDSVGPKLAKAAVTDGYYTKLPDLIPALRRVIAEVDHDLGFRLMLRVLKAYFMPISQARNERYAALCQRFGYYELAIHDGDLNVWDDLVD
jgi:hypothetical protein